MSLGSLHADDALKGRVALLWDQGLDTAAISERLGVAEAKVEQALNQLLDQKRREENGSEE